MTLGPLLPHVAAPGPRRLAVPSLVLLARPCLLCIAWVASAAGAQAPPDARPCGPPLEVLRLGEPSAPIAFFRITAAFLGQDDDRLFVLDAMDGGIRSFSLSAIPTGRIGRRGGGPGEFRQPAAAGWVGRDLWVWDPVEGRLSVFHPDGELSWLLHLGPGGRAFPLPDGTVARVERIPSLPGPVDVAVQQWDRSGRLLGTLATLHLRSPMLHIGGSDLRRVVVNPFSDDPLWGAAVDGSTVIFVDRRTGGGPETATINLDILRPESGREAVSIPYSPVPLSRQRVDHFVETFSTSAIAQLRQRGAPGGSGAFDPAVVRGTLVLPAWEPTVTGVQVSPEGRIWLRREHRSAGSRWTLLDPSGRVVCDQELPAGWRLQSVGKDLAVAVVEDEMGVEVIVVFAPG